MSEDVAKEAGVELIDMEFNYKGVRDRMYDQLAFNVTRLCQRVPKVTGIVSLKERQAIQKQREQALILAQAARGMVCPLSIILAACETAADIQEFRKKLGEAADQLVEYTAKLTDLYEGEDEID